MLMREAPTVSSCPLSSSIGAGDVFARGPANAAGAWPKKNLESVVCAGQHVLSRRMGCQERWGGSRRVVHRGAPLHLHPLPRPRLGADDRRHPGCGVRLGGWWGDVTAGYGRVGARVARGGARQRVETPDSGRSTIIGYIHLRWLAVLFPILWREGTATPLRLSHAQTTISNQQRWGE